MKHLPQLALIGLSASYIFSPSLYADEQKEPLVIYITAGQIDDSTTVTASRTPTSISESLYSTTIITREEIEQSQATDVSQILHAVPGIQIGRNGGPGQATSIFMRGAASDHTLILIDGVPAQSGTAGTTAIQHIDPSIIERIEIVRGPASTLYGTSAIGGVIQIFTRRGGRSGTTAQANGQAGSQDSQGVTASIQHRDETWNTGLAISRYRTDGYPSRSASTIDRGYENTTFNGHLGFSLNNTEIEFSHFQADGFVEYLDFFLTPVDQDTSNRVTRLSLKHQINDDWNSQLLLSRTIDSTNENQANFLTQFDFAETKRYAIDWQNTFTPGNNQTWVAGITLAQQDTDLLSFGTSFDQTEDRSEAYLQNTTTIDNTNIQLGGRFIQQDNRGNHLVWTAAIGQRFNKNTRGFINAGTAFRVPTANDLYGFGGNPSFDNETSKSFETGIHHLLSQQHSIYANLFYTKINNLIESDPFTSTIQQIESARIYGSEIGHSWNEEAWSTSIDYVWQSAVNEDQNKPLARRAKHKIDATIRYQPNQWWAQADVIAESKRSDSRFSTSIMPSYNRVNLSAGYQLDKNWQLEANIKNVFDTEYELAKGFPAQERIFNLGIRFEDN